MGKSLVVFADRGAQLQDLELGERFSDIFVRQIRCHDPIEKLYYSVGKYHQPVCIHCSSEENHKKNLTAIHSVKIALLQGKSPSKEEFDLC